MIHRLTVTVLFPLLVLSGCGPQLEGDWKITANCRPESEYGAITILASASVVETSPNEFSGEVRNNLGQTGRFKARLSENRLTTQTTWDGLLPTQSVLVLDRSSNTFTGTDSNACDLIVVRP